MERILIVDDDQYQRVLLQELSKAAFVGRQIKVDFAEDGLEAVKKALTKDYCIIFMDIDMPFINGSIACVAIKSKRPEMIIVAASSHYEDEISHFKSFNGYLRKPILRDSLTKEVNRFTA
jgi:CheY-like chemotaxis protein